MRRNQLETVINIAIIDHYRITIKTSIGNKRKETPMEWYDKGRMNHQGGGGGTCVSFNYCSQKSASCTVKTSVCTQNNCVVRL